MTKHTPLPWFKQVMGGTLRLATQKDGGDDICVLGDCHDEQKQANADFILNAVNALEGK